MACHQPVRGWLVKLPDGKQRIRFKWREGATFLELPCGQCLACRVSNRRDMTARLVHEASCHVASVFVTLTYAPEHEPPAGTLVKRDLMLFLKRVRKHFGNGIRFYAVGEYGETTWRPHYHALLFGVAFGDKALFKGSGSESLFTSPTLSKLWGLGHASFGQVTAKSAGYCAGYATKKLVGSEAKLYGDRLPPFAWMSRKPGLGARWFSRFKSDVFPSDEVVLEGSVVGKAPRYYDVLLGRSDPELLEEVKAARKEFAQSPRQVADNTTARLRVRAACLKAKLSLRKRSL